MEYSTTFSKANGYTKTTYKYNVFGRPENQRTVWEKNGEYFVRFMGIFNVTSEQYKFTGDYENLLTSELIID